MIAIGRTVIPLASIFFLLTEVENSAAKPSEPYQWIRNLRKIEDHITHGDLGAVKKKKEILRKLNSYFNQVSPDILSKPKNIYAALTFALSGGSTRIIRNVINQSKLDKTLEKTLQGSIYFIEGRWEKADKILSPIDIRLLDSSIAPHIGLVKAALVASRDKAKAIAILDDVRLLGYGSLFEQEALRQQSELLFQEARFDGFINCFRRYISRFSRSAYLPEQKLHLIGLLARMDHKAKPHRLEKLFSMLDSFQDEKRAIIMTTIAKSALKTSNLHLAQFVAQKGLLIVKEEKNLIKLRLYEAAAKIVTNDYDEALETLEDIPFRSLSKQDRGLLNGALIVAQNIRAEVLETTTNSVKKEMNPQKAKQLDKIYNETLTEVRHAIHRADQNLETRSK